jgi:UDP-glucose 4-epimerase
LGCAVTIVDNFSSGRREFLENVREKVKVREVDLIKGGLAKVMRDHDAIYHLAANANGRVGERYTKVDFRHGVVATHRLLEAMRRADVPEMLFTSTSTVYGEATRLPTPEDYGPMLPISLYGGCKLAAEALIASFCGTHGFTASILRFANVVGARSTHGVIHDFIHKLHHDPRELEILGREPGTRKSYVHITDCIEGLLAGHRATKRGAEPWNLGTENSVTVKEVADIVVSEMGLGETKYRWTGGVDEGRGWRGDVREMLLSVEKLKATGWRPRLSSAEAIRWTVWEALGRVPRVPRKT